jgi:hypothetical protein
VTIDRDEKYCQAVEWQESAKQQRIRAGALEADIAELKAQGAAM